MRRSTAFQTGIAMFVLVGGGLAAATASSGETPDVRLQALIIGDTPPPTQAVPATDPSPSTTTTIATTTTMVAPTTDPSQIARMQALDEIPGPILSALGGETVKVIGFSTFDERVGGWTGGTVTHVDGGAEFSVGVNESVSTVGDPVAFVTRLRYGAGDAFWVGVQTGTWDTPSYRQWGIFGDNARIAPNVWEGSELRDVQAPSTPGIDGAFWLVVGIDGDNAFFAVFDETEDDPVGTIWEMPWDRVDRWRPVVNVFEGSLWMDEYYVLVP